MADISDIYGKNYLQEAQQSKTSHLIKMISNNVSNYEFNKHFVQNSKQILCQQR